MSPFWFLLTITWVIRTNLADNSPEYDYSYSPDGGEEGECRFKGTISTGNNACKKQTITRTDFKQNADLTWKILTKACPDLIRAGCADPEWSLKEHDMDELEWRSCNQCPRCACNAGSPSTYYIENRTSVAIPFKSSICYDCKCDDFFEDDNGNDVYARDCDPEAVYNSPTELQNIHCPETTPPPTPAPTGGCSDNAGNSRAPGEYFFIYDQGICNTYCMCNSTNGLECEQGYDNIIASEKLKYAFWDNCGWYLQDAFNDTSRYGSPLSVCELNANLYGSYSRCPRVSCGTYSDGNRWDSITYSQTLYDDNGDVEDVLYHCGTCECDVNGHGGTGLQVDCETYDEDVNEADQCILSDLTCDNYNAQAGFSSCNEGDGEVYCGWSQMLAPDGFDPDTVCIEDAVEASAQWGCMKDFVCDSFYGYDELQESSTGICSYNVVKFTAASYDCINYKWLKETYQLDTYFMCCAKQEGTNGYCNSQPTISETALGTENECKSNGNVNRYVKATYECAYGSRGISNKDYIKELKCGVDLPDKYGDDKYVCDRIKAYWQYYTGCSCKEAQTLEKTYPSDEYHDNLRQQLQLKINDAIQGTIDDIQGWADAYECDTKFECDITDKGINNKLHWGMLGLLIVVVINYM